MLKKYTIKISVRELVEFVLRSGDLFHVTTHKSRMTDAIEAHVSLQEDSPEEYTPEVSLSRYFHRDNISLLVRGRADGVWTTEKEIIVDEIKTTYLSLDTLEIDHNLIHWAQVKIYAFIYAMEQNLSSIKAQLTYFHMETKETKKFEKICSIAALEDFTNCIIDRYFEWVRKKVDWIEVRDASILQMDFPFDNIRAGQHQLMQEVEEAIDGEAKLFVEAPTGIGKTIATIFPSLQKIAKGNIERIFYLTAKNTANRIPQDTLNLLRQRALRIKSVTITAKDKVCFCDSKDMNDCPFTIGFFDRVNMAIEDLLTQDCWNREVIVEYAKKHRICSYEFSLEMALWADCIICDYNYAFDPRVYLRRFFLHTKEKYCFLIDEAHNLIDRGRSMFSAEINKKQILQTRKKIKDTLPQIAKDFSALNRFFLDLIKEEQTKLNDEILEDCIEKVKNITSKIDHALAQKLDLPPYLIDMYFTLIMFHRVATEFYDENFYAHLDIKSRDATIHLMCLNPALLLQKTFDKASSSILFSATLKPIEYYTHLLSVTPEHDLKLQLPSPFSLKNLGLFVVPNIATSFRKRERFYETIASYIAIVATSKKGNYLVFFPSYVYMEAVYDIFTQNFPHINTLLQQRHMDDDEREEFLGNFVTNDSHHFVGFVVMGGVFAEGIDLVGEKLSGVVVVGIGLPQICAERNLIREHFDKRDQNGFAYAYAYPGMNKVMQAAGRAIRTEKDVGVVVLLGERFSQHLYQSTMPKHWYPFNVHSPSHLTNIMQSFWDYPRF